LTLPLGTARLHMGKNAKTSQLATCSGSPDS